MAQKTSAQQKTAAPAGVDAGLARALYTDMVLIRRFEEKDAEAYALGKIGGFLHLYIGEEAVAVGATSAMRPDDYAIAAYREHGHCLAKGADPKRVLAETEIWKFGRSYNIPSEAVDGMDILAIRDVVARAVERARADGTPSLIEARTYRFRGHSMRDPAGAVYRTKEEVEREKLRDPISLFREKALKAGWLSEADVRAIEKDVNDRIDDAVAFADASPEPPVEWLLTDIYKED